MSTAKTAVATLSDREYLEREKARRELARRSYKRYLYYVHGDSWKRTRFSDFLADTMQKFVETDTGNAYDILLIESPPQHGKEVSDSTPVPTPNGWKKHGDLHPGDYVFGRDGKPVKVLAEIPQPEPASLLVTFIDGSFVKVHPNHEWVVQDRRVKRERTLETREMMAYMAAHPKKGTHSHYPFSVDHITCVEYPEAVQPVDPYVFGLWLGDGSTTKPCITHHPNDMEPIHEVVRRGYQVSTVCEHKTTGILTTYFSGVLSNELKLFGFCKPKGSRAKYIPDCYKIASVEQRLDLLAGMIDSDGYVYQPNGRITISNINKQLIDDFDEVCRSLGLRTTVSAAEPVLSTSGVQGVHTCYQLTFNPDRVIPTKLPRKKVTKLDNLRRRRAIVKIEECEPEHGKCITVEGGVYLVGPGFVLTHNSLTVTESFPSWYLGRYPKHRVIEASYNDDTAKKFGRKNMQKVEQFGGALFGLKPGAIWTTNEFELSNGWGRMLSAGIKAGITGNPANLLIIDDPIKNREEADSQNNREKIWNEWQNTLKSRLQAKAKVIIIMTPWHEDDLAARVLKNEQNVTLVRLPVEAEEQDLLGRAVGDALCPELGKDNEWLRQFKQGYLSDPTNGGLRAWQALYQCSPRTEGGNIVQRSWWKYYNPRDISAFGTTVISVDAAFKDAESNDYVAIQVWSKLGNNYYGRFGINKHLDFPATLQSIRLMKKLFPETKYILIEDKANGSAIIQVLRHEFVGVIAINPKGGKVSRVNSVAPAIESGNIYLPENELWAEELVDQFSQFPAVEHDDAVDATSQALNWMLFTNGRPALSGEATSQQLLLDEAERREQNAFLSPKLYDVYSFGGEFY